VTSAATAIVHQHNQCCDMHSPCTVSELLVVAGTANHILACHVKLQAWAIGKQHASQPAMEELGMENNMLWQSATIHKREYYVTHIAKPSVSCQRLLSFTYVCSCTDAGWGQTRRNLKQSQQTNPRMAMG
jgi:hypothetical protein